MARYNIPPNTGKVRVAMGAVGGAMELRVEDSGPGIPPEMMDRLFEAFASSKPDGMGVGLSISRTIVEAHEGSLSAENRDAGGACFLVKLPLASQGPNSIG